MRRPRAEDLLSTRDVAQMCGDTSPSDIQYAARHDMLPGRKVGNAWVFTRPDALEFCGQWTRRRRRGGLVWWVRRRTGRMFGVVGSVFTVYSGISTVFNDLKSDTFFPIAVALAIVGWLGAAVAHAKEAGRRPSDYDEVGGEPVSPDMVRWRPQRHRSSLPSKMRRGMVTASVTTVVLFSLTSFSGGSDIDQLTSLWADDATATKTPKKTKTPTAGTEPSSTETSVINETPIVVSTEIPVEDPTEIPSEVPTEPPTEVPPTSTPCDVDGCPPTATRIGIGIGIGDDAAADPDQGAKLVVPLTSTPCDVDGCPPPPTPFGGDADAVADETQVVSDDP